MNQLEHFVHNLCGTFNNEDQVKQELENNNPIHPHATHINGICNDKINNLPKQFPGYFMIEESYYHQGDKTTVLPHLFLFNSNEHNNIVLTSYDLPSGLAKEDLRNDNNNLEFDYEELVPSDKFTPMIYTEENGCFSGESISHFSPQVTFILKEKITPGVLEVSENFYTNDQLAFGFAEPIVYKRID